MREMISPEDKATVIYLSSLEKVNFQIEPTMMRPQATFCCLLSHFSSAIELEYGTENKNIKFVLKRLL